MKSILLVCSVSGMLCAALAERARAAPMPTAFTYQGKLQDGGHPVDGTYELRFTLYGSSSDPAAVAGPVTPGIVTVTGGLFTVAIDFGVNVLEGSDRWLGIEVRPAGGGSFTLLTPRQQLTPTPYALQTRGMFVNAAQDMTLVGSIFYNQTTKFLGINRSTRVTANEFFGLTAPVAGHTFGGMYIQTTDATGMPFYGYAPGGSVAAYHYYDGADSRWKLYVGGQRMVVENTGNVGIGPAAADPENILHVGKGSAGTVTGYGNAPLIVENSTHCYINLLTPDANERGILFGQASNNVAGGIVYNSAAMPDGFQFRTNGNSTKMVIDGDGNVGIGVSNPARKLQILSTSTTDDLYALQTGTGRCATFQTINSSAASTLYVAGTSNTSPTVFIQNVGAAPSLQVVGTAQVGILEVTGADVAEKFLVSEQVEPGMVLEIDVKHAGKLCIARGAYNRRVAGVVSGANNLPPGTVLGNMPETKGAPPVALNGRVWVYCDANDRAVELGDLLTTANRAGHAMAVTDFARATGATLGKAMTGLEQGKVGLVLVLVNLQ